MLHMRFCAKGKGKEIVIVINGLFVFYGNVKWKISFQIKLQ